MRTQDIKTIEVIAKEWFDRQHGNSYFNLNICVHRCKKNEGNIFKPMQYGYGDHYRHVAFDTIKKELNCFNRRRGRRVPRRLRA